jgi:hypothetical protein
MSDPLVQRLTGCLPFRIEAGDFERTLVADERALLTLAVSATPGRRVRLAGRSRQRRPRRSPRRSGRPNRTHLVTPVTARRVRNGGVGYRAGMESHSHAHTTRQVPAPVAVRPILPPGRPLMTVGSVRTQTINSAITRAARSESLMTTSCRRRHPFGMAARSPSAACADVLKW